MADPFKAYDIRGIYPDQLDGDLAEAIGNAIAQVLNLGGKSFCVGRDMRLSGPDLKRRLIQGLVASGVQVIDTGMHSTPCLTFAMHHLDTAGGCMVTASHNPSAYGGFKITGPGFKPVGGGSGMEDIEAIARDGKRVTADGGRITDACCIDAYCESVAELLDLQRPLRVVVDGGNGISGVMFQHLAAKLPGIEIIPMLFDPDGRFPNHDANPLKPENIVQLQERVRNEQADFGAAFDGDGDRCALVDETGATISCDLATALLARYFLDREAGATVAYDLRSSKVVPELIAQWGGTPVETRVGHSYIKQTLKETGAVLAGELSGHYYFRDFFGADSGLYAFILLCNVISTSERCSALIAPMRKYHHSGEINFTADKDAVFAKLKALGGEVQELDGVTVRFPDWWCNVRASNTEPVVRLNLEADSAELLTAKLAEISDLIANA